MDSPVVPMLQPFAGERFASSDLTPLLAPPYDVITPAVRAALVARSPHNIVHLILPDGNGDRYENAAKIRRDWRSRGVLRRDPEPAVYVLAQRVQSSGGEFVVRTGMIAAVAAEPYAAGRIRPHEKTHAGPKEDRLALMRSLCGTFESIFLIAPDNRGLLRDLLRRATVATPTSAGTLDGVDIRVWRVTGPVANELTQAVEGAPLYIADGHHRYETTLVYRGENKRADRTAALVVPATDSGLTVLATHRVVRGLPLTTAVVRECLTPSFEVADLGDETPAAALVRLARERTACVVALQDGTLTAALRPSAMSRLETEIPEASVRALDVARVDRLAVAALQARSGGRALEYTASLDEGLNAVRDGASAVILLNPTSVAQVFAVADAKGVMPQKSTYFVPKVPSGLAGLSYEPL